MSVDTAHARRLKTTSRTTEIRIGADVVVTIQPLKDRVIAVNVNVPDCVAVSVTEHD